VDVVIQEIVTEVVVAGSPDTDVPADRSLDRDELVELVVRRATERVLEILRREWER